jgi:histidinol-phosphate phosphatase family protein
MALIDHLIIVAGGKGTRLAALVGDRPKVLVPVGGKTILEHQLDVALRAGVRHVTIFAGYMADSIKEFVGDGSKFGLQVRVEVEQEPLGNAGAVLRSLDSLPKHFFVLYGDVMLAVDLDRMGRAHLDRHSDFTPLVHPNDHPYDSDLVEADGGGWVTAIHTCPHPPGCYFANLVNAAAYVVRRDALRPWVGAVEKQDFVKDIMQGLLDSGAAVLAYRSTEYAKDMGTPERLVKVEADWKAGKIAIQSADSLSPAVFLDRDGTLNEERGFLASPDDLELIPDVCPALKALRNAGYRLVVLTNQPVLARGEATDEELAAIHRRLEWELGKEGAYLDGIYHCPHHPDAGFPGERVELKIECHCRKPNTGMVESACRDLHLDPARSWMIGDRTMDIEMARRAGLMSVLVGTGAGGKDGKFETVADHRAGTLAEAAAFILASHED